MKKYACSDYIGNLFINCVYLWSYKKAKLANIKIEYLSKFNKHKCNWNTYNGK